MKINGLKWTVETIDADDPRLNEDGFFLGLCVFLEQKIYLRAGMSKELTRHTLIHELVHAIRFSYGIKDGKMDEEQVCEFVAAHFDTIERLLNGFIH